MADIFMLSLPTVWLGERSYHTRKYDFKPASGETIQKSMYSETARALGGWRLAVGGWLLAVGSWPLSDLSVVRILVSWCGFPDFFRFSRNGNAFRPKTWEPTTEDTMRDFRDFKVWELAHQVVLNVYDEVATFPRDERFNITSQLKRSAFSVPSNIAEGCGRFHDGDFRRFVSNAAGSSKELEYQLFAAYDLKFLPEARFLLLEKDVQRVQKMLRGLYRALS